MIAWVWVEFSGISARERFLGEYDSFSSSIWFKKASEISAEFSD
jgi:hypothetical protein